MHNLWRIDSYKMMLNSPYFQTQFNKYSITLINACLAYRSAVKMTILLKKSPCMPFLALFQVQNHAFCNLLIVILL